MVITVDAVGTSLGTTQYSTQDIDLKNSGIYYYRITQFDTDGKRTGFMPIAVAVKSYDTERQLIKIINIMGEEVDESYDGIRIIIYDDGSSEKIYNTQ